MDFEHAIVKFGAEGVLRYRTMSNITNDNELPEVFLGGFTASRLYDTFLCSVRVEELYSAIAISRGVAITQELTALFGGYRADVAMFPTGLSPVVIELKIFDERCQADDVSRDLQKLKNLADVCDVQAYVGVMICESREPLETRIDRLKEALNAQVFTGETQRSSNAVWRWCFGCARLAAGALC
jgi:hypothetical protein